MAISIDEPSKTIPWVEKKGLTMPMLSDPQMKVLEGIFHVRNPKQTDLPIHAVYIVDSNRKIFYRKVGRRRPMPPEFIAAVDHWASNQPKG